MNAKSILFHLSPKGVSREIDRYTPAGQLAGTLPPTPPADQELEALRVAMRWADDVQKASVHFVCARPGEPAGFTGNAYSASCNYPVKLFSVCAWASYLAEFLRYMKNDQGVPVHVLHVIDEPRWVFRHNWEWFGLTFDQLWERWPAAWAPVYAELDRQMKARGCRTGTNILILSDTGSFFKKNGVPFDDVKWLYQQPDVAAAGDGLGLVSYGDSGREITQLITDMRASLAAAGWPNRQIFFKDVGGIREQPEKPPEGQPPAPPLPFPPRRQFDYGLDAFGAMLRAARLSSDFFGQYFWVRPEPTVREPYPTREFAVEYDETMSTFKARYTLHLFSLFTRTQEKGAVRLRDTVTLPARVSFLALENLRATFAFRSYYFVNESTASVPVDFAPARNNALQRYSVDFAINSGLTVQHASQPLTNGRARFTLAPQSAAVLTERPIPTPLNWTPTV
jgi:hypothetical protein